MTKCFILLDKPTTCAECPFCYKAEMTALGNFMYEQEYRCKRCPKEYQDRNINAFLLCCRPHWCPLKNVPEKQVRDYPEYDRYITGYDDGWDDCLEQILGERNE